MSYHVEDWAGNVMNYGEFASFQDGWDYVLAKFPNDEDSQEYYVVESKEGTC